MDPTIAVIVIGVLYPVSFAAFVFQFARLRSDLHAGFDRLEVRFDEMDEKFDAHFDQLGAKFDDLDMALARKRAVDRPEEPSGADN